MTEPTFDQDGYPTEKTLEVLEHWPFEDVEGALRFAQKAWYYPEAVTNYLRPAELELVTRNEMGEHFMRFATGGWSGNESVIAALKANTMVWAMTWCLTARGGLYIFQLNKLKAK